MKEYLILPSDNTEDSSFHLTVKKDKDTGENSYMLMNSSGNIIVYAEPKDGEGYVINGQFLDYSEVEDLIILLNCMKELDKSLMPNYELTKLKTIKTF